MRTKKARFDTIESKIAKWAWERGIIQNSSPEIQWLKAIEEIGELHDSINVEETIDALGDICIALLNGALVELYRRHKLRSLNSLVLLMELELKRIPKDLDFSSIQKITHSIYGVSAALLRKNLSLIEVYNALKNSETMRKYPGVMEKAYEVIKDRKGKLTPEGNFIKEEDLK